MAVTATITSKGQLTLPKAVRKILDTNTVEIEVIDDEVRLKPVRSVAGALGKSAVNVTLIGIGSPAVNTWPLVRDSSNPPTPLTCSTMLPVAAGGPPPPCPDLNPSTAMRYSVPAMALN